MNKKALSLAETLITLTIIGFIAVLAIPNLYSKYQKHLWATQLHKAYQRILVGANAISKETGNINYFPTNTSSQENFVNFNNTIRETFSNATGGTFCKGGFYEKIYFVYPSCNWTTHKSTRTYKYKSLNGQTVPTGNNAPFMLYEMPHQYGELFTYPDGMAISIRYAFAGWGADDGKMHNAKISHYYFVDINGIKDPNTLGRDIFFFVQYLDKKIPIAYGYGNPNDCTPNEYGLKCAARIMKDGWVMKY